MSRIGVTASASLTAENTFTDWLWVHDEADLSVSGTWVGTLTLQRTFDGGTTVKDVVAYTANTEKVIQAGNKSTQYRIGFKTGGFTSGTAVCLLAR